MSLIFKTDLIKGATGDTGNAGTSFEIPTGAIIAYDGGAVPDGYELTSAPEGFDKDINKIDFRVDTLPVKYVSLYGTTTAVIEDFEPSTSGLYNYNSMTDVTLKFWLNSLLGANNCFDIYFGDIEQNEYNGELFTLADRNNQICAQLNYTYTNGAIKLWLSNGNNETLEIGLDDLKDSKVSFYFDYNTSAVSLSGEPFIDSGAANIIMELNGDIVASRAYPHPLYFADLSYIPNCIYFNNIDDTLSAGTYKPQIYKIAASIK